MKNKSLRFKLLVLSGFLLMVSVVVGGIGFWSSSNVVKDYSVLAEQNLPNTRLTYEVLMQSRQGRLFAFQLAMPGLSKERAHELIADIDKVWLQYDEAKKEYLTIPFGPGEEEIWNKMVGPLDEMNNLAKKVVELYKKNPDDNSEERKEMIRLITVDMAALNTKARAAGGEMRKYQQDQAEKNSASAQSAAKKGNVLTVIVIVSGVIAGLIFAILFSNDLVKTLTAISSTLTEAGVQVGSGATQIASASQELSQATTEQAASLEQTAASIEEMNQMIAKNTDNAQRSSVSSKTSKDNAQKGKETVEQMISSIDEINKANVGIMNQVDYSNAQMQEIVKVIAEIGNKTKVINDIVFQTKLLSFNASVEAARAGEHGKGFAVVAEEVGNLAAMSGNAAQEISGMLEDSIRKVETIVNESKTSVSRMVEEGKRKVDEGTKIAQECGEVLQDIVESIECVAHMNEEISRASLEQTQGMTEITKAMHSLDQVTQQNSATSEQAASAAEQLSAQAEALNTVVRDLVMAVQGSAAEIKATHKEKKKERAVAKILPLKKATHKPVPAAPAEPQQPLKKVSGESAPSYNDNRFTDV